MSKDGSGKILVLKTGEALAPVREKHGDFDLWITEGMARSEGDIEVAAVYAGDPLPPAESLVGVVVTGSPSMVTDRPDWSERSAAWLARVVEGDVVPVLGICYGHQLMAHGLGGLVGPNPKGREMGTVEVDLGQAPTCDGLEDSPIFRAGRFPAHMSHVESVLEPPKDARVLATTALEPHAALQFGPRQWGVQFHPEFDGPIMCGYIDARQEILASEGLEPDAMREGVIEAAEASAVLRRFGDSLDG